MRKSKFTDKQIVEILWVIEDGAPVVETLREKGVSKDTYYKWKQKFNGMQSSDVKKLRELERENAKLKKCMLIWHLPMRL